jgi:hypothetical protein
MFGKDRLYASISHHGVGTFCNKELKANDIAMEVEGNYTISSYDTHFPYISNITEVLWDHVENNRTSADDVHLILMILNINWIRYKDNSNRFFRIYFDNLPKFRDSLLYWDEQEKLALKKMINDPIIDKDLLYLNNTNRDFLIEDIKRVLRKIDMSLPMAVLADYKIDEAMDIILSRSFRVSLKGWKIIHNKVKEIEEDDVYDNGYILVPGADAINHEKIYTEHPDVEKTQIKYESGRVVIRAGRKFKKGEEFTINYDVLESVYGIFRRYGFVPIESLYKNMIFRSDWLDMSMAPKAGRLICLALGACIGSEIDTHFRVPKFTNKFDLAHLTIERLNHWYGPPFTEEKMFEIYNMIVRHQHSNLTEAMALSKFAHSFYGFLLYSTNFKVDINSLISMYNLNEQKYSVKKNIQEHMLDRKVRIIEEKYETNDRFREILKYSLVNHHIVALNTREAQKMMNITLDNLMEELKNEILEQTS